MIKAIFFDFGGVLVEDRYTAIVEPLKCKLPPDRATEFSRLESAASRGKIGEEFLAKADEMLGISKLRGAPWIDEQYAHPNPEVINLITGLKRKYKVGMLSNNFLFWAQKLRQEGWMKVFETVVISAEVGMTKPDREIYLLAAERIGNLPAECFFIDNIQTNVDGAMVPWWRGLEGRCDLKVTISLLETWLEAEFLLDKNDGNSPRADFPIDD